MTDGQTDEQTDNRAKNNMSPHVMGGDIITTAANKPMTVDGDRPLAPLLVDSGRSFLYGWWSRLVLTLYTASGSSHMKHLLRCMACRL